MTLFPNPTTSELNLRTFFTSHGQLSIRIIDINGRQILERQESYAAGNQEFKINISTLPSGSYLIQVNTGLETGSNEFIIE